jgi:hypothetical protein
MEEELQARARLGISQKPSISSDPPSLLLPSRDAQVPPAHSQWLSTMPGATFPGLQLELRDMIYALSLKSDPQLSAIENPEGVFSVPNTNVLSVSSQIRKEAIQLLRTSDTWSS